MTKTLHLALALTLTILFSSSSARAISLGFDPIAQTVQLGDTVNVNVGISGLGLPPFVSAFDLDVSFNPGVLSFNSVVFGTALGDPALVEAITGFSSSPPLPSGNVNILELSFLEESSTNCILCIAPYLADIQFSTFTLATLSFGAIGVGTSALTLSVNDLVDGNLDPLGNVCVPDQTVQGIDCNPQSLTDVALGSGSVTVEGPAAVPEPGTLLLFGSGLACLAAWRRRKRLN